MAKGSANKDNEATIREPPLQPLPPLASDQKIRPLDESSDVAASRPPDQLAAYANSNADTDTDTITHQLAPNDPPTTINQNINNQMHPSIDNSVPSCSEPLDESLSIGFKASQLCSKQLEKLNGKETKQQMDKHKAKKDKDKLNRKDRKKQKQQLKQLAQVSTHNDASNQSSMQDSKTSLPTTDTTTGATTTMVATPNVSTTTTRDKTTKTTITKQKLLVDGLKIFQNHNLINQQDPIHHLQQQLSELNKDDCDDQYYQSRLGPSKTNENETTDLCRNITMQFKTQSANQELSTKTKLNLMDFHECNGGSSTIKKGALWELRNYDKLSSKIFSRWKKRYFILTIDYFVCFKRSVPKVGQSEMGKFLYKVSNTARYVSRFFRMLNNDMPRIAKYMYENSIKSNLAGKFTNDIMRERERPLQSKTLLSCFKTPSHYANPLQLKLSISFRAHSPTNKPQPFISLTCL